jgi:uncharacterized membrane protein YcaP (DUF421 family)
MPDPSPPRAPSIEPRTQLSWRQRIGLPIMIAIPIVALFGVFGGSDGGKVATVLRVAFVYVFIWACFRILGKRELSQLAPFEFVMLILIPQFFSRALIREDLSMTNAIVAATTLFSLVFLTSVASFRFRGFRHFVESDPTVLVSQGELLRANLGRERIAPDDIFSAMHKAGIERIEQVRWAILESDGKIAIIRADAGEVHNPDSGKEVGARH